MRATNQITRMNNGAFQNKNKRPQRLLGEGGPLKLSPPHLSQLLHISYKQTRPYLTSVHYLISLIIKIHLSKTETLVYLFTSSLSLRRTPPFSKDEHKGQVPAIFKPFISSSPKTSNPLT